MFKHFLYNFFQKLPVNKITLQENCACFESTLASIISFKLNNKLTWYVSWYKISCPYRFRCIVPYPPNSEYELELRVGDVIYVHKKREDGWYKGTQQRTGKTGLFPASFVETFWEDPTVGSSVLLETYIWVCAWNIYLIYFILTVKQ